MLLLYNKFVDIYEISPKILGKGGFGVVYAAKNKKLNHEVAVKTTSESYECHFKVDPQGGTTIANLEAFLREFRKIFNEWGTAALPSNSHSQS